MQLPMSPYPLFFFFNDTATTEIYTLSLHDALPISQYPRLVTPERLVKHPSAMPRGWGDRKSTRLNSSQLVISYAVFCLKKKKMIKTLFVLLHSIMPGTGRVSCNFSPVMPNSGTHSL